MIYYLFQHSFYNLKSPPYIIILLYYYIIGGVHEIEISGVHFETSGLNSGTPPYIYIGGVITIGVFVNEYILKSRYPLTKSHQSDFMSLYKDFVSFNFSFRLITSDSHLGSPSSALILNSNSSILRSCLLQLLEGILLIEGILSYKAQSYLILLFSIKQIISPKIRVISDI
jgi:hypothetical protein